jgi:hypothetical protein
MSLRFIPPRVWNANPWKGFLRCSVRGTLFKALFDVRSVASAFVHKIYVLGINLGTNARAPTPDLGFACHALGVGIGRIDSTSHAIPLLNRRDGKWYNQPCNCRHVRQVAKIRVVHPTVGNVLCATYAERIIHPRRKGSRNTTENIRNISSRADGW